MKWLERPRFVEPRSNSNFDWRHWFDIEDNAMRRILVAKTGYLYSTALKQGSAAAAGGTVALPRKVCILSNCDQIRWTCFLAEHMRAKCDLGVNIGMEDQAVMWAKCGPGHNVVTANPGFGHGPNLEVARPQCGWICDPKQYLKFGVAHKVNTMGTKLMKNWQPRTYVDTLHI
jgi:hypothetical protein